MKCITIKQPFASLIAEGLKEYEFRTWKTNYRGEILIRAGKTIDKKAMEKFERYNLKYPTGCIIAKADLTDCIKVDDEFKKVLKEENELVYSGVLNNKDCTEFGFKLENVEKIKNFEVNGKLSLWEYNVGDLT